MKKILLPAWHFEHAKTGNRPKPSDVSPKEINERINIFLLVSKIKSITLMTPAQFFKCLSEDIRLYSILLIFGEGELCVCELMEALDESQPKISRHLAQLRSCGLLHDERREQWVYYSLKPDLPQWILSTLDTVSASQQTALKPLLKKLKAMKDRPARC